ncbi:EpsG family protein [Flavobacterium jejuense]|uniref:EpsG family protein n=1 Tax=Flavobacterium jejuense TaxID=1544455 RepID=A0ABX0ITJ9_9FLAO|nr:EpsG family protein [Flavobacterium jejuense]NHN26149.1 EpsG family protein [Flavobacterium jejuense]
MGVFIVFIILVYIGLRPLDKGYMGDTGAYLRVFNKLADGSLSSFYDKEYGFMLLIKYSALYLNAEFFFLICASIYVYLHYLVSKKIFKDYWYFGFIFLVSSFSFWAYGTNGIRNGLGAAIVLYAFTFENKKTWAIAIALIGTLFHKSMLLPVMAYILTFFYNNRISYLRLWLLCIPLSLIAGGSFELIFASLGFGDERISYLTDGNVNGDQFAYTGFRWDFLLYSASAVYTGWYFIVKKNFEDKLYHRLFNVYLFSNAFWILIIRANFSNRFAYLSWFMMGVIIIYPFLKQQMIPNQTKKTALVLFFYFMFTFILNVILA